MSHERLHERPLRQTPEFVSIFLPANMQASPAATNAQARSAQSSRGSGVGRAAGASQVPPREVQSNEAAEPEQTAPQPTRTTAPIDWFGEAEKATRDQVTSDADRKRRANWLSRGTDPETHPLVSALKPMFGKRPEFGWSHEHTHRVEPVPGGALLLWINRRCVIAFLGLAIIPACAVGHIETNGALFEHMPDDLPLADDAVP